jgi:glycosyltransferase involved in cell wall biosynthesis
MDPVSIVIPCYNPSHFLLEAIASARAQRGCAVEVVLVNDGTDSPQGRNLMENARGLADRYLEQPNRGLPAARNTGFDAASHQWIIPLDSDDRLEPEYAAACGAAIEAHPDAAFAYTDCHVFGAKNYIDRLPDYNLYRMLARNTLTYAALIRKRVWAEAGGYDESMTRGYEDWEFWLNLGARGRFGQHVRRVLFEYRKHGPSLLDTARAHHDVLTGYIRGKHPELYEYAARARVKARWAPAVTIVAAEAQIGQQSILDWQRIDPAAAPSAPGCDAFLHARTSAQLAADSAELAALAVWGGKDTLEFADGSVALSWGALPDKPAPRQSPGPATEAAPLPPRLETIRRHLANAGLLSWQNWARHPVRSAGRLIPLRIKEQANRMSGRRVFDLSFYLQFQPSAVESYDAVSAPLEYMPEYSTRRRIGLITPHLGPGGAERVLLEIAAALDPRQFEVFLIATQSTGDSWRERWNEHAGHVYDLRRLLDEEKVAAGVYCIVVNWKLETLLIQNSLQAYSMLPQIKKRLPDIRMIDLIHAVNRDWNQVAATRGVDAAIDVRVAVSDHVRRELIRQGVGESKIQLISNGVDLERFRDRGDRPASGPHRVLFAGRLEAVKRPLLLAEIARQLRKRRGRDDFRFVVAGDGPEAAQLRLQVHTYGLDVLFEFRGQVADVAPELAACEMVVLPSRDEGIPLIVLEAFAASRPVVASAVGGVPEVVTPETGILVPRDKEEIATFVAALDLLIGDPGLRQRLGANGRRLVERGFDRRRALEAYRSLFE